MKVRRIQTATGQALEMLDATTWTRIDPASDTARNPLIRTLVDHAPLPDATAPVSQVLMPFQPRSYRDFMLYERHYIQAARGYVRRFRPGIAPIARVFETVTRRTFPAFKPAPLWYQEPIYYMGNHLQFVTDGAIIPWPRYTNALDYELELGFLVVRPLYNATPTEALAAIGGFVVFNDFSARDVQTPEMDSGFGPQKAKHFCNAIGSVVVSADEVLPRLAELQGQVRINGRQVAVCAAAHPHFSLGEALAHASAAEHIYPGEFFGTGTWPNGSGMETNHWLQPGDTIEIAIDSVGQLRTTIGPRNRA